MLKKILSVLTLLFIPFLGEANFLESSIKNIVRNKASINDLRFASLYVLELDQKELAVPLIKEHLLKGDLSADLDVAVDKNLEIKNLRPLESLPLKYLANSRSQKIQLIFAKKLFHRGKFKAAQKILRNIDFNDDLKARAKMFLGTIQMLSGNEKKAIKYFENCIDLSGQDTNLESQIKDFCTLGVARSYFAKRDFVKSEEYYLDVDKKSFLWPATLIEEAWNSFYMKKYNRSLGKLVTYNSPLLSNYLRPEASVLTALTYLKMCLYKDVNKEVDTFYKKYRASINKLQSIYKKGVSKKRYGKLLVNVMRDRKEQEGILGKILSAAARSEHAKDLYDVLSKYNISSFEKESPLVASLLKRNASLLAQYSIRALGELASSQVKAVLDEFSKAFRGMSYIKLEALKQRKEILYAGLDGVDNGKRGELKYLKRTRKQYFWGFNGEFWADELGDYVFALRGECRQ